ncbi:MAG: glycosyltransferase family 4 protein [Smithellaceae bacterium]
MRIGLNLLYLIPGIVGGTETYARGLLRGLRQIKPDHEFFLFVNRESAGLIADDDQDFTKVVCPVYAANRKNRYYFEQVKLRQYVQLYKIDLLHSLAYTSPLFLPCPAIVSLPDLNFKAFGNSMPLSRRLMLSLIVWQAVSRSSKVITISNFSREEILKQYHIPSEKVVVTYLAADNDDLNSKVKEEPFAGQVMPDLNQPYALAFSSSTANKNLSGLIKAFLEAKKNHKFIQKLILMGHKYPIEEDVQGCHESEDIVWTGYLERRTVLEILRRADFMLYPSFYEGFGLPVLEAMAAGVPVICSNAASIPEVVGDAGIFFDPFSIKDMAAKIAQAATDQKLRDDLRQKGFKNLERFSWRKTAEDTVAVYEQIFRTEPKIVGKVS